MNVQLKGRLAALLENMRANYISFDEVQLLHESRDAFNKISTLIEEDQSIWDQLIAAINTTENLKSQILDKEKAIQSVQQESRSLSLRINELLGFREDNRLLSEELSACKLSLDEKMQEIVELKIKSNKQNERITELQVHAEAKEKRQQELYLQIKQREDRIEQFKNDLDSERIECERLMNKMQEMNCENRKEMEKLKFEMGEKLIKAQSRMNQGQVNDAGGGLNYREVYRQKLEYMERKYEAEILELKNALGQQVRK